MPGRVLPALSQGTGPDATAAAAAIVPRQASLDLVWLPLVNLRLADRNANS